MSPFDYEVLCANCHARKSAIDRAPHLPYGGRPPLAVGPFQEGEEG